MFANEVVSSVLGDVWGRRHPRRLGLEFPLNKKRIVKIGVAIRFTVL
jgi:hypothetical protein